MKKTISVNIKGLNFQVEEDAYELLQNYLERLKTALGDQEGANDIIEDIEIRIAELCSAKLSDSKTAIELGDIEEILATLGDPSDYLSDEDETEEESGRQYTHSTTERRLYRDEENGSIAGVCAGIANYFNMDVAIIRIIFVVILLFGGFGVPLYIILWIVIPKAKNTIDRLRMKGRPVTVETVKEEVENAAEKIKDGSKKFARRVQREDYGQHVNRGARIISSIIGIGLIGFGFIQLIGFLIFVVGGFQFFPIQSEEGFISLNEAAGLFLAQDGDVAWAWTGGLMVSLSVIMFIFLLGSILLFRIKNRWGKLSLLTLFITGIIGGLISLSVILSTAKELAIPGEQKLEVGSIETNELTIVPVLEQVDEKGVVTSNGRFGFIEIDENNFTSHGIDIEYLPSSDSSFHIYRKFSSQGRSNDKAIEKIKNIDHKVSLKGDTLFTDAYYSFDLSDKWRFQEVRLVIRVPKGGQVKIDGKVVFIQHIGNDGIEHPYYIEKGKLYGDGSYRHRNYQRRYRDDHDHFPTRMEDKFEDLEEKIEDLEHEIEQEFD